MKAESPPALPERPSIVSTTGRRFDCFPVAMLVVVVDDKGRLLLLSRKGGRPGWQVIGGALKSGETVRDGALREAREEAGSAMRIRPLGVAHSCSFVFDDAVQEMIDVVYVMAYEGGAVVPSDDMRGATVRWASIKGVHTERLTANAPGKPWLLERALQVWQVWRDQHAAPELEPYAGT